MTSQNRIISAVDHVIEPPTVWTDRLSKSKFGARIPHLERGADGSDRWIVDGRAFALADIADVGALLPDRVSHGETVGRHSKAPPMIRRRDCKPWTTMALATACSIRASPGFPASVSVRWPIRSWPSPACKLTTTGSLMNGCKTSNRFIPQCIVPLSPIEATVAEIRRAVGRGHRGVIFPAAPMQLGALPHINGAEYDPVWAVCQELEIPLCFRAGSAPELFQFPTAPKMAPELAAAMQAATRSASAVFDLTNILFSRILLRFPKLKVIFAESTIGWGTYLLEYADHQYEQDHCDYPLKPSEMFHRQCYLTTWYDEARINARHVGVDNILWSTNFPAANSTWPDTRNVRGKMSNGHEPG